MSALKGLTFAAYTRPDTLSEEVKRRLRLIAHLQEQLEMVSAEASGTIFSVTKRKWQRNDDGTKTPVETNKRLKAWYSKQANGTFLLTVRYGSRPIEFEKGKAAIVLKSREELTALLPKLISAVEAGEFDTFIAASMKHRPRPQRKAA